MTPHKHGHDDNGSGTRSASTGPTVNDEHPAAPDDRPTVVFSRNGVWDRLADDLVIDIASGRYRIGQRLPSIRQLMAEYQCSDKPAQRALQALVGAGIVEAAERSGYYVKVIPYHPQVQPGPPAAVGAPPTDRLAELERRVELLERLLAKHRLLPGG